MNEEGEHLENKYIEALNSGMSPEPKQTFFQNIWNEYERVVLQSLVTSFGLDFLVHDQFGGDVDTIQNIRTSKDSGFVQFKNPTYQTAYENRGKYDGIEYHKDPRYTAFRKEAKEHYNATGEKIPDAYVPRSFVIPNKASAVDTWHFANLDHVVSAHEIHDDPARFLAGLDGKELANAPPNFRFTSEALNKRMSDSSIPDFIKKVEENPSAINWNGVDGAPMPDEVKQALLDADKQARADIDGKICTAYYSGTAFALDAATAAAQRGIEMGARQALGFVFLEIWFACKKEIQAVPAGGDFSDTVKAVIRGIPLGLDNARKKYKYLISQFEQGFTAGALASLTTTLINIFVTTDKDAVKYIRFAYTAVIQAGNVILFNPDDLPLGDQLMNSAILLANGACTIAGAVVGDAVAKTPVGQAPHVGIYVQRFTSVLVSGLLSCSLLMMLDESKFINDLVGRMNVYASDGRDLVDLQAVFNKEATYLEKIDLEKYEADVHETSVHSAMIADAKNENVLADALDDALEQRQVVTPWGNDIESYFDRNANPATAELSTEGV